MSFSRKDLWNDFWENRDPKKEYINSKENNITMELSSEIFSKYNITSIEDWGCGNCVFKEYLDNNIKYVGVDGSNTGYQNKIEDLTNYVTEVDSIYLRHVLEHNNDYKKIFKNALESFRKVLILVLFTPFTSNNEIDILNTCDLRGKTIPDIAFNKKHLIDIIEQNNCSYELLENIKSKTMYNYEQIFIIKKE
jgi:hypothetical protein